MRRISVSTALFDGHSMETAIHEIAEAGAVHVEPAFIRGYVDFDETAFLPAAAAKLAALTGKAGLRVLAASAHFDLGLPEAPDMLRRRIDFAARVGAPFLITNAGAAGQRGAIVRAIEGVAGRCEEAGVVLALENPGHGTGDLIGDASDGAALIAAIGSPHIRLNYDLGNVLTYSQGARSPAEDVGHALPVAAHIHLKDVAARGPDWVFTPLGQGDLDFKAIWQALPADLPVGIELPLRLERPLRADPVRRREPLPLSLLREALRSSLNYVAKLDADTAGTIATHA